MCGKGLSANSRLFPKKSEKIRKIAFIIEGFWKKSELRLRFFSELPGAPTIGWAILENILRRLNISIKTNVLYLCVVKYNREALLRGR